MTRVLRTLVAVMPAIQIAYFVVSLRSFNFGGANYLESPIATLAFLYVMLFITIALLFVLLLYKER